MKIPIRLTLYIVRHFLLYLAIVLAVFLTLIFLLDGMELVRKSQDKDVSTFIILQLVFLKSPEMIQKIMPFAMLLSTVFAYTKLTRSHELVAIRSAGLSVWQFLLPGVVTAFLIGVFMIVAFNPLGTTMLTKFDQMESKYYHGRSSFLDLSSSGIWLRQKNANYITDQGQGETVIHANTIGGEENISLYNVIIFVFETSDKFSMRIDAEEARLLEDFWRLKKAIVTIPDSTTQRHNEYFLETDLTISDIQKSFAKPNTISFWSLPEFIDTLKKSGFSALPHRLHWHATLVSPLFYAAMIFIAALFSLHPPRQGKTGFLITGSILAGFLIYFLTNFISSLGLSGSIPIILAAWAPVGVSILIGVGFLLHFEDG